MISRKGLNVLEASIPVEEYRPVSIEPDTSTILANLGKSSNGKCEFCRLLFGLKNAPSIFQRAIDDVIRTEISKSATFLLMTSMRDSRRRKKNT